MVDRSINAADAKSYFQAAPSSRTMANADLEMRVDDAHLAALDLSAEILEYCNAYRRLSTDDYLGRERLRYLTLLTMFEEMSKLMLLLRDCERAVTHKDPFVKVTDFYVDGGQRGLESIIKEIGKSEMLFLSVKKILGREPSGVDFSLLKEQFAKGEEETMTAIRRAQFMDVQERHRGAAPAAEVLDMFFDAIETNAQGAFDFLFDWVRAKELDVEYRVVARRDPDKKGMGAKTWVRKDVLMHGKKV
jgi:hypothetical protein